MTLITPARLGLMCAACLMAAAVLAFSEEALAAAPGPCADTVALQQQLNDFDARWNASDAWGLTERFAPQASLGTDGGGSRQAVYHQLIEQLGQPQPRRSSKLMRATALGDAACLVDVQVVRDGKSAPAVFVLNREGIVAMR